MLSLLPIGVLLFIGTHVDDLLLLLSLFAARNASRVSIVIGQYIGVALLLGGSLLCALFAVQLPHHYLRWCGVLPIALGLYKVFEIFRPAAEAERNEAPPGGPMRRIWSVTLLTVAGGGDNVGVYLPLFATRAAAQRLEIILIFLAMTGPWCWLAHWLAHHRLLQAPIERFGSWLLPVVLIGLGLHILLF